MPANDERMNDMSESIYEGKSKTLLPGPDDQSLVMQYRNTATAGDGAKREEFAGKGQLNAAISHLIFGYLAQGGVETHLIEVIDETSALVRKAEIVPVEVIVRNLAAGSFSRRFGVEEGTALANTVVEFSLKSDELSDPMINELQITALGLATPEELVELTRQALLIDELLTGLFAKAGIMLVDFKLEFGRFDGRLILCDEISPDSCRLWDAETYQKLDKDVFRRDLGDLLAGYRDVLARLQGALQ
jgi:phosphoribosylaminoimidazole-succinocarboxamide synthase